MMNNPINLRSVSSVDILDIADQLEQHDRPIEQRAFGATVRKVGVVLYEFETYQTC